MLIFSYTLRILTPAHPAPSIHFQHSNLQWVIHHEPLSHLKGDELAQHALGVATVHFHPLLRYQGWSIVYTTSYSTIIVNNVTRIHPRSLPIIGCDPVIPSSRHVRKPTSKIHVHTWFFPRQHNHLGHPVPPAQVNLYPGVICHPSFSLCCVL